MSVAILLFCLHGYEATVESVTFTVFCAGHLVLLYNMAVLSYVLEF